MLIKTFNKNINVCFKILKSKETNDFFSHVPTQVLSLLLVVVIL